MQNQPPILIHRDAKSPNLYNNDPIESLYSRQLQVRRSNMIKVGVKCIISHVKEFFPWRNCPEHFHVVSTVPSLSFHPNRHSSNNCGFSNFSAVSNERKGHSASCV